MCKNKKIYKALSLITSILLVINYISWAAPVDIDALRPSSLTRTQGPAKAEVIGAIKTADGNSFPFSVKKKAKDWLALFKKPPTNFTKYLESLYGTDEKVISERKHIIIGALEEFIASYGGDEEVIIVRCPARINLRGMHVDTHGGGLNPITHDRETVMVAAAQESDSVEVRNVNSGRFEPVQFSIADIAKMGGLEGSSWDEFINEWGIASMVFSNKEKEHGKGYSEKDWHNYVIGAVLSVQNRFKDVPLRGFKAVINGNIPLGAALSSSHSLVSTVALGTLLLNNLRLSRKDMVTVAQDTEWFTGARSGLLDQGAMIYGKKGQLLHTPLFRDDLDAIDPQYIELDEEKYSILVIESYKTRIISDAQKIAYCKPRFAYSVALKILKVELKKKGYPARFIRGIDRLSRISPEYFKDLGGAKAIYEILKLVPEDISIYELLERYPTIHKDIMAAYNRYFGTLPDTEESLKPAEFNIRGPLLFGISECRRAQLFFEHMQAGREKEAFEIMDLGHEGDRVSWLNPRTGTREEFEHDVSDAYLDMRLTQLESGDPERTREADLERQPGSYRASGDALDTLVDIARSVGRKKAPVYSCLTGAGIAGVVIAVVEKGKGLEEKIATAVYRKYYKPNIAALIKESRGVGIELTEDDVKKGVRINTSIAGLGVIDPRAIETFGSEEKYSEAMEDLRAQQEGNYPSQDWPLVEDISVKLKDLALKKERHQRDKVEIQESYFLREPGETEPRTFIVTGAGGFIGSHLVKRLLAQGHTVIGIDEFNDYYSPADKYENIRPFMADSRFVLYEGDFRDLEFLRGICRRHKVQQIVHLGARAGVRPSIEDPHVYESSNITGTLNMFEIAKEFGIKDVVYASSSSVYGGTKKVPFTEDQELNPISPYAWTKLACENLAATYHNLYGIGMTGLRFFTVYGPGGRPDMAIRMFTEQMLARKPITMYGDGSTQRDYTYIDDIIDGVLLAVEHSYGKKGWDEVFNLGESDTTPLLKLVLLIAIETKRLDLNRLGASVRGDIEKLLQAKGRHQIKVLKADEREAIIAELVKRKIIKQAPEQLGDVPLTFAGIKKAKQALGYNPQTKIYKGIGKTVAWHLAAQGRKTSEDLRTVLNDYAQLRLRVGLDSQGRPRDPKFTRRDLENATELRDRLLDLLNKDDSDYTLHLRVLAGIEQLIGDIAAYLPRTGGGAFGLTALNARRDALRAKEQARPASLKVLRSMARAFNQAA